jgi:hypothetical protein
VRVDTERNLLLLKGAIRERRVVTSSYVRQ